ncbi:unnamed protein product [Phytomonas sp. EM1]|nr:unnamed protein product [Phytomonas sp. EM1]|eukprot:CCW61104.1 unnamed protein product [Phytomonas sp. isolate EM1]
MFLERHFKPYAIPAMVWVCAFVLTKRFPGLLQTLSMRFPSDETPLTLANLNTSRCDPVPPDGLNSVGSTSFNGASQDATRVNSLRFPLQLLRFCVSLLRSTGWSVESNARNRSYRRAFIILATSMTSLLIHTSRWNLLNSIIVYAYTLSIGKKHFQRYEAVTDVIGGFLGATLTNIFLHLHAPSFSPLKQRLPPRSGLLGERPFLLGIGSALIVMLATLFPFHSFSSYFLTPVSSRSLQDSIVRGASDDQAEVSSPVARASSSVTIATTNESGRITSPEGSASFSHPSAACFTTYVCGGETFSYALSGFRFIYRSDVAQLRGAVWGYWIDWLHNYSTDMRAPWWLSGFARDLLGTGEVEETTSVPRTAFFTSTTSQDLHHMNALAFVMGAGVAWVAKLIPKLSLVNSFIGLFYELPPPPIAIPSGLMDSVLTDLSVVRVCKPCLWCPSSVAINLHPDEHSDTKVSNSPPTSTPASAVCNAVSEAYIDIPVPPECFCPITRNIMRDPVTTVDGFTYDREAIEEWLHHRISSPMTNLPLKYVTLVSNRQIYRKVQDVVAAYNDAIRVE